MKSLSDKVAIQFSSRVVVQGLQMLDGILLGRWLAWNVKPSGVLSGRS